MQNYIVMQINSIMLLCCKQKGLGPLEKWWRGWSQSKKYSCRERKVLPPSHNFSNGPYPYNKTTLKLFQLFFTDVCYSALAVKRARQIASHRIHVERAIGRLKNFKILQGTIPLTSASLADEIVTVCASLCNLMKPLAE